MSDQWCPGRCNGGARRRSDDYDRVLALWQADMQAWMDARAKGEDVGDTPTKPFEPTIYWTPGTPIWCGEDQAAIRAALTALDELMALRLRYCDGYQSNGASEPVAGSKERPSPSPAQDELSELLDWLSQYERPYRESQSMSAAPYRGGSAPALTEATSWALAHLDRILAHPVYAIDYGEGILWWHNRLENATKTKRQRLSKPLRCPQCHLATLSQWEGEDRIECRNRSCGENRGGPVVMTIDEYQALAVEIAPTPKQARETLAARREPVPFADYGQLSGRS